MSILVSPGVDVQILNESMYSSAGAGTVPLIVIATATNKASPSGTGIAPNTVPAEAGKLFLATSQRELVQSFGNPIFKSVGGTPLHANEQNEFGLHAAYSYLGISNRAYILRADVDLAALEPQDEAPVGPPVSGTFWHDLAVTRFGLFLSNGNANAGLAWTPQTVLVPTGSELTSNAPSSSFGSNNSFAFVAVGADGVTLVNKFFEKIAGTWVEIGTNAWTTAKANCTVTMTNTPQYPSAGTSGSIWLKLSSPNRGADWTVKRYNAASGQWVLVPAPFFNSDSAATANGITGVGQLYTNFNTSTRAIRIRRWNGTAFADLSYEALKTEPHTDPEDGTLWYSNETVVDIMVNSGGTSWVELSAHSSYAGAGVQVAGSAPELQADGTALVNNDIWINSADLENYPRVYRFNATTQRWVLVDNTDQTTPFGIVFADARPKAGDDVDPDAPEANAYPDGVLLWNMRASTGNVKVYRPNHFEDEFRDGDVDSAARWVSASGNRHDGAPHMFRKAQRQMVVQAMQAAVSSNEDIRSEVVFFNLVAAPGYPELIDELITLNVDQKEVAFVVGDTPSRLVPQGLALQNWATNAKNAATNGDEALLSASPFLGVYYPWGLGTNVDGQEIMIPPSTIALRTMAYNDQVAYPWFAPAGTQRGLVSNAVSVGYLTSESEYRPVTLNQGQRDVLYLNKINPIAFMPGQGLMVYGQKTLDPDTSALDRINVARLVNYMRYQLDKIVKPFLFQPNDGQTRDAAKLTVERFLVGLVGLRALEDFAVLCDETNNTPERRNRNELWIDIACIPVKSVEFIYVPVRIRESGNNLEF